LIFKGSYWKVSQWEGQWCQIVFSNYFPKSSIKSYTLSLQTPRETAVNHPEQVPQWWKVSNTRYTQGGIVTDYNACHAPKSQDGVQCISFHQGYCQPVRCTADSLQAHGDWL